MTSRILLGILLLSYIGCRDQGPALPQGVDPYLQWKSHALTDYTIDQYRMCFCADGGITMRVVVRGGTVYSVTRLSDSVQLSPPASSRYLSVDSLFAIIRRPGSDSLFVTYDAQFGYPDFVDINPQLHPIDGGVSYRTLNLRIP